MDWIPVPDGDDASFVDIFVAFPGGTALLCSFGLDKNAVKISQQGLQLYPATEFTGRTHL